MRFFTGIQLALSVFVAALACAVPATALAQGEDVIRDCAQDGDLDRNYSQDELDDAYKNLPSDIDEYSNCREVIERARERSGGGDNNSAGSVTDGATAAPGDPGDSDSPGGARNDNEELQSRAERSATDSPPEAGVADRKASEKDGILATGDESDGLPTPLVVALILAALAAIGGGLYLLRDHLPPGIASRLPGSNSQG